jgi:hypothetical protein
VGGRGGAKARGERGDGRGRAEVDLAGQVQQPIAAPRLELRPAVEGLDRQLCVGRERVGDADRPADARRGGVWVAASEPVDADDAQAPAGEGERRREPDDAEPTTTTSARCGARIPARILSRARCG